LRRWDEDICLGDGREVVACANGDRPVAARAQKVARLAVLDEGCQRFSVAHMLPNGLGQFPQVLKIHRRGERQRRLYIVASAILGDEESFSPEGVEEWFIVVLINFLQDIPSAISVHDDIVNIWQGLRGRGRRSLKPLDRQRPRHLAALPGFDEIAGDINRQRENGDAGGDVQKNGQRARLPQLADDQVTAQP